jgi:eukaryotic translation initiation factor 2C
MDPSSRASSSQGRGRGDRGGGRGGGGRGGGGGGRDQPSVRPPAASLALRPAKMYTDKNAPAGSLKLSITIRQVKTISLESLLLFAAGKQPEDDSCREVFACLSIVLRYVSSLLYVPVRDNFYSPIGRVPISGGLEIWRGLHQSLRGRLSI